MPAEVGKPPDHRGGAETEEEEEEEEEEWLPMRAKWQAFASS
jgi:hypothetical protein